MLSVVPVRSGCLMAIHLRSFSAAVPAHTHTLTVITKAFLLRCDVTCSLTNLLVCALRNWHAHLVLLCWLVDERLMDVGDDTTAGDGGLHEEPLF
jgi:hypothetical protein